MSDLNAFLAEASSPEPAAAELDNQNLEPTTNEQPPEPEPSAEQDQPPEGMDRKTEAIWREERAKRKELQGQVDQMNQRWQMMVERMQQGQVEQPAPQQPQPTPKPQGEIEVPDFDDDPIGHLRAKNDLLERQLQEVNQERQLSAVQRQQMAQFSQLQSGVDQMEQQFASQQPDYHDAVGFLYENVGKMATAMGYPPGQVQQVISQTAMDISVRALQQGKNPAQAAYEAARAMGFTGPQPTMDDGEPAPQRKPPTSLSNVAGRRTTGGGAPTWDAISKMDDQQFEQFWKQMEKSARG
jgi:hypothetical protein